MITLSFPSGNEGGGRFVIPSLALFSLTGDGVRLRLIKKELVGISGISDVWLSGATFSFLKILTKYDRIVEMILV